MAVKIKYIKCLITLTFTFFSFIGFSQNYELSDSSSITINGTSTLHDWTVSVENQTCEITIIFKKKTKTILKNGSLSNILLNILVKDIVSKKGETMDKKAHKALKIDKFPVINFKLIHPVKFDLIDNNSILKNLSGVLSIAGVEKPITAIINIKYINERLSLSGTLPLKLSDFNIEPPTAMFGQIETGNDIIVNINLEYRI